jgi:hypothetical protein
MVHFLFLVNSYLTKVKRKWSDCMMKIRAFGRRGDENPDGFCLVNVCHGGVHFSVREKETELYGNIRKSRHFHHCWERHAPAWHLFFDGISTHLERALHRELFPSTNTDHLSHHAQPLSIWLSCEAGASRSQVKVLPNAPSFFLVRFVTKKYDL